MTARPNLSSLLSDRVLALPSSGIRRAFELGATMTDPVNLSIGQPDFPVPDAIKNAAIDAIRADKNGYTVTQGDAGVLNGIIRHIKWDIGWEIDAVSKGKSDASVLFTSGTSGALQLVCTSLLNPGDELIIPDPYFVLYPALAELIGAKAVRCDTYPDFRMTAARVEPLITPRTKAILIASPGNPSGVVNSGRECEELLDLCRRRGIVLISDEIYDEFTYSEARTDTAAGNPSKKLCPSPARRPNALDCVVVIRGFGKTYGCTGWRLGYATGPRALIEQMTKLQQYTFVCAPSALQHAAAAALHVDMSAIVKDYEQRRNLVVERLSRVTDLPTPGGAFYAFVKIPEKLGLSASQFFEERCVPRNVILVPGGTFSGRDTHVRLSYAAPRDKLLRGLDVLCELMA
ncbi:MAG: aminotransferase class I/II-fold pyridoxal phosphate-dependent enzyme [Planctomycetota bacterium]|nr:aminotransferase class I/II-fold pyridoxal phosphate-dependent enzyme [Planctomycetota bacterium]